MYRAVKSSNKITAKRYQERCHELHMDKLSRIRPSVDNKPPKRHSHLRKNLKKEQMMEERFAAIEHENRLLLNKMSRIMQQSTSLDNASDCSKYAHSLNKLSRKNELSKITVENQALLRRIQCRQGTYDHLRWEEERRQQEEYLRMISEYPERKGKRGLPSMDPEYRREAEERARRV